MSRKKGPDEIYCQSCGAPIKKMAEICPECGVPNEFSDQSQAGSQPNQQNQRQGQRPRNNDLGDEIRNEVKQTVRDISTSSSQSGPHDPASYSTTTSDSWHYGVAASLGLWVLGLAIPEATAGALAGLLLLIGWVLMPMSMYFDKQWLRATTQWNPSLAVWGVLAVIPIVNLVAGIVYLLRRRSVTKVSTPTSRAETEQRENKALNELRERYSRGELTDAEFEKKVEGVIGTEDRETAEMYMESGQPENKERSEN